MPYVVSDECILCGACEAGCPNGAIHEGDTKSVIDYSLCVECGTCADNCPSAAITFVEEDQTIAPTPLTTSGETKSLAASSETKGLTKGDSADKGPCEE